MDRQDLQRIRALPHKAWCDGIDTPGARMHPPRRPHLPRWVRPWVLLAATGLPAGAAQPSPPPPSASSASSASPAPTTIRPAVQAARDADRQRILREEQAAAHLRLQGASRQVAERLAARDDAGAQEAQRMQQRAQADLQALARELQQAPPAHAPGTASQPNTPIAQAPQTAQTAVADHAPQARSRPWWDVYGKGPRAGVAASRPRRPAALPLPPERSAP